DGLFKSDIGAGGDGGSRRAERYVILICLESCARDRAAIDGGDAAAVGEDAADIDGCAEGGLAGGTHLEGEGTADRAEEGNRLIVQAREDGVVREGDAVGVQLLV